MGGESVNAVLAADRVTSKEVMKRCGIKRSTLELWIKGNRIRSVLVSRKKRLFDRDQIFPGVPWDEPVLTVTEALSILKISKGTLFARVRAGRLALHRTPGGSIRFLQREVELLVRHKN